SRIGARGVAVAPERAAIVKVLSELARDRGRLRAMRSQPVPLPPTSMEEHLTALEEVYSAALSVPRTLQAPLEPGGSEVAVEVDRRLSEQSRTLRETHRRLGEAEHRATEEVAKRDAELSRLYHEEE